MTWFFMDNIPPVYKSGRSGIGEFREVVGHDKFKSCNKVVGCESVCLLPSEQYEALLCIESFVSVFGEGYFTPLRNHLGRKIH